MLAYADYVHRLRASHPELAVSVARFVTLEHVLNWLPTAGIPYTALDMVTQDEYCHDLLMPWANDAWLVFGMT